jgi:hypothetical protein
MGNDEQLVGDSTCMPLAILQLEDVVRCSPDTNFGKHPLHNHV